MKSIQRVSILVLVLGLCALTAVSADKDDLEDVPSPMVAEMAIPSVVKTLMKGAWLFDRSAAHLVVEDAVLRSVGFGRTKKKKEVTLLIRAEVASIAAIQSVDRIEIELLDASGEHLAREVERDLSVGSGTLQGTKYVTLEHKTTQPDLDALFADGAQPMVRVTITEED